MPVRKLRTIADSPPPATAATTGEDLRSAIELSELCVRLARGSVPPGVHRNRSIVEAQTRRRGWEDAAATSAASVTDLRAEAAAWIAADPDPATRAELQALLDAGDDAGLAERFRARLEFGTAGIRGPLGAGPARMNRVVVRRVTAGLAAHLLATDPRAAADGVVVGRDARHGSREFAADTAGVLAAAGLRVHVFPGPVPTPLLAFAVRHLGAAAGVQVTASHNPAPDNGYKVYARGGAQIAPPTDAEISARIDAVAGVPEPADLGDAGIAQVPDAVLRAYRAAALAVTTPGGPRDLRIAYTPLHGVGGRLALDLLSSAGFAQVHVPEAQAEPDPRFATAPFPNPELPGVLDLVLATAAEVGAHLVLANDPDADRIAVAVPDGGTWRTLSGDEVGWLLAEDLLSRGTGADRLVATTVVSSQLLARIAAAHGVAYAETLTGFKWLAAAAADHERAGRRIVLAYEQALGVMIGGAVRDKDGLSAALAVADLAARLRADGRTLLDALGDLARRHGLHLPGARNLDLTRDPSLVDRALHALRTSPPTTLAGVPVRAVEDRAARTRTHADGAVEQLDTPATELMGLLLADGSRLQLRPSGTEPLLKAYGEVVEPVPPGEPLAGPQARATARLDALLDTFLAAAGLA